MTVLLDRPNISTEEGWSDEEEYGAVYLPGELLTTRFIWNSFLYNLNAGGSERTTINPGNILLFIKSLSQTEMLELAKATSSDFVGTEVVLWEEKLLVVPHGILIEYRKADVVSAINLSLFSLNKKKK